MNIQARAAVADGKGSFSIESIEVHEPKENEVLVAVQASGVCHTDYDSLNWGFAHVMGHEGAGIVEAVGEGVDHVKVGDKVLLNWAIPCKSCFQCLNGKQNICEVNSQVTGSNSFEGMAHEEATTLKGEPVKRSFNIGTLSSHTVVKKEAVIPYTTNIPFTSACIIGCGVMTGYGSVVNSAKLVAGSSAVVLGTGGVGLNSIQGARISGAAKIIAIDVNQQRLEMAKQFGATHTILASREDKGLLQAAEEVKKLCGGRGADYAFECTGVPALGAAPLAMIRSAGTAVQVSGIEEEIVIDMNLFEWDKIYINPLYGSALPEFDFPKLLELYERKQLKLDELITRTYALEDLQEAINDLLAGRNAKGVITFS
ncbi:MAG: Zn-dependent alcohol dehydrogenase [Coraliomargaritaceae bacterium]